MDFIERIFGIDPDGGTGWLELALLAMVLAGAVAVSVRAVRRSARK